MTEAWILYRCSGCGASVSLLYPEAEARCGRCRRPLDELGPLPAGFYSGEAKV